MTNRNETPTSTGLRNPDKPEGPVAAAILAAGVGALALGVLTTLAEVSTSISDTLNFYDPVGPLSGKTILTVVVWLISWVALHVAFRTREVGSGRVVATSLVLIALGVLGTFPTFFQAFAPAE